MSKKFLIFLILVAVLGGILVPAGNFASAQLTEEQCTPDVGVWMPALLGTPGHCILKTEENSGGIWGIAGDVIGKVLDTAFSPLFRLIGYLLMTLTAGILSIVGILFDTVVKFTVVDMAVHLGKGGLGDSITGAWTTIRDVANMAFIFVLLFVAFKAMFQLNFGSIGKNIRDIVIVALLINFSLFFSKVVIDASNIVAIGFYKAIAAANPVPAGAAASGSIVAEASITDGYMRVLGLQGWHDPNVLLVGTNDIKLNAQQIFTIGFMSSIFFLVTAVIFLISAIMLVARFVLLIFIMILSPLALIAFIVPGLSGNFWKWWRALIDQSFFAPLFFALTWVALKIAGNSNLTGAIGATSNSAANPTFVQLATNNPKDAISLVLNYVIVIGFAIAALVIAKQMATKTAGFKVISGGIGAAAAGGAAWVGRQTVGRIGEGVAGSSTLNRTAREGNFATRNLSRLGLYAGKKAQDSTFDVRKASVPTSVVGDAIRGAATSRLGKKMKLDKLGLDDVNIPSVSVGPKLAGDLLGKPGEKGYKQTREESKKRVLEREAAEEKEYQKAKNKKTIEEGKNAAVGSTEYKEMEKVMSDLSAKQTEELVASNRDLLESQNFANMISVKQLEAINNSDQFSDEKKEGFRNLRFADINAALKSTVTSGTPLPPNIKDKIKSLSDSELEMMGSEYLDTTTPKGREFIATLKASQAENIIKNKNGKFTRTQSEAVKTERIRPLKDALIAGRPIDAQNLARRADIKTMISYLKIEGRGGINIGLDPAILPIYTPSTLTRMAAHEDMSDDEIRKLRTALLTGGPGGAPAGHPDTVAWLNDKDKGKIQFSA